MSGLNKAQPQASLGNLTVASTAQLLALLGTSSSTAYEGHTEFSQNDYLEPYTQSLQAGSLSPTHHANGPPLTSTQAQDDRQSATSSSRSPSPMSDFDTSVCAAYSSTQLITSHVNEQGQCQWFHRQRYATCCWVPGCHDRCSRWFP